MADDYTPVEHSHVYWPRANGFAATDDDIDGVPIHDRIHRMWGTSGHSSHWTPKFPNDDFVSDEAVTLEEMRSKGAV